MMRVRREGSGAYDASAERGERADDASAERWERADARAMRGEHAEYASAERGERTEDELGGLPWVPRHAEGSLEGEKH